jgi:hypothetical protein
LGSLVFLVSDSLANRARHVRSQLSVNPSVAVVVAAAYFEWSICRVIVALSCCPNVSVREDLAKVYGLERYKDFWLRELKSLPNAKRLPQVVTDWPAVTDAFDARNKLVHARDRYIRNMAAPKVEALLVAVSDVWAYANEYGLGINKRLPVRRQPNP